MSDLINVIKKAALQVFDESQPSAIFFGSVVSISPLKIQLEQRLTLEPHHLVLTSLVSNFDVDMTVNHSTESTEGHIHGYQGVKTFTVNLGLAVGEKVILMRIQGGQKYIVLDRARGVN